MLHLDVQPGKKASISLRVRLASVTGAMVRLGAFGGQWDALKCDGIRLDNLNF
jgi:hypothetical protein